MHDFIPLLFVICLLNITFFFFFSCAAIQGFATWDGGKGLRASETFTRLSAGLLSWRWPGWVETFTGSSFFCLGFGC